MNNETMQLLDRHFATAFAAPDGIKKLRELILTLAMRGKLVPQDPNEQPASELLKEIAAEKAWLVQAGKITKPKPLPPIKSEDIQEASQPDESKNRFALAVQIFHKSLHDSQLELNRYAEKSKPVHKQSI